MKLLVISVLAFSVLIISCKEKPTKMTNDNSVENIFPKGEPGPPEHFTGKAWNFGLVSNDSINNTLVGNVYFEPGARSNWHSHPSGQILIITGGVGFHQIQGQPRQTIKKGDVVICPPNVMHWHGASPNSGLQQLYIIPNTDKGIVRWLHPVSDKEYNNGK